MGFKKNNSFAPPHCPSSYTYNLPQKWVRKKNYFLRDAKILTPPNIIMM